ncbi:hypothetical protein LJY25_06080 [Hymenobacter sp. BT175]|uniref:hypothetical protein n=1 Tax=Hymenobacter translucens TaxID=2886507 RepID=UPI001D0E7903|nr:hypothetical protein [Hymenobacter translucens]MCC2546005.1 hypothetical protein [Hymenobacter translucens]
MHSSAFLRLLPSVAVALLLSGCYSREDMNAGGEATRPETEETTAPAPNDSKPAPTTAEAPEQGSAAGPLAQASIFLEVSGSMEGFMPKASGAENTRFQQHAAQFLSDLNRSTAVQRKSYFRIKEKPYADSYQQLSQTVRSGIQQPASSTDIPSVLDTLVSRYYAPNSVSVLISDFIYSPKNAGAIPYISTDVTDALNRAGRSDLAVSVYGYTSDFRGAFYPALKTAVKKINPCCDTDIPYYFWVVGPADAVRRFDALLLERQPAQQAHFGVKYPTPASSLLNRFQNVGSWYYGEKDASKRTAGASYHTVAVSKVSAQEPVEFVVGLDLKTLPALYRDVNYLKPNLQLQAQDTDAKIVSVFAATDQTKNSSGAENLYTHFVKVRVTRLGKAARPLQLTLNDQRPGWIGQWTTKNDSNINQAGAKTFALSSLLDGVAAVTTGEQEQAPVFRIPLTLQPAD